MSMNKNSAQVFSNALQRQGRMTPWDSLFKHFSKIIPMACCVHPSPSGPYRTPLLRLPETNSNLWNLG